MFKELCSKGPTVIIDCEFEHLMLEQEKKSMSQQLAYVYSINKKQVKPCNIVITGIQPDSFMDQCLTKAEARNWTVDFTKESFFGVLTKAKP